jgi:esterase
MGGGGGLAIGRGKIGNPNGEGQLRDVGNHRLSTRDIVAEGATPERWVAVLHGILGAGRNWASVLRRVVRSRSEWGAVLVDLRQHGHSLGFPPPHTMERAAADLDTIEHAPGLRALIGHSFGGKVALLRAHDDDRIAQVWVMDSTPAARSVDAGPRALIRLVRSLPDSFASRHDAVAAMTDRGVARPVARWMATNLAHVGDEFRWRLDFDDMEALINDFSSADLWSLVEEPRPGLTIHFVRATRSPVLDEVAVARIRDAAGETGCVHLHEVDGGHWINGDNPDALVGLLRDEL